MAGGSSGGGGTTTTKVEYSPTEQAFRDKIMNAAGTIYDQSSTGGYTGAQVAGQSADTLQAQQMARDAASSQSGIAGQASQGASTGLASILGMFGNTQGQNAQNLQTAQGFLDVNNNPNLAKAADASTAAINKNLQRNILPSIGASAVDTGNYGGSRQGIAEGLAMSDANQQATDAITKMYSDAYTQGMGAYNTGVSNYNAGNQTANTSMANYSQLLSLLPQVSALQTGGSSTLSGVGAQNENYQQQLLDYLSGQQTYNQNGQWSQLGNLANIIYGGSNGSTSTTQTAGSGGGSSGVRGALGGAAAGASMGSMFGPWGTGIGAAAGGLYGLLS